MSFTENFIIDQGADAAIELHLTNKDGSKKDLTGISPYASIKKSYEDADSDAINFSATVSSPATNGIVSLSLTNEQTSLLNPRLKYVYDVILAYLDSDSSQIIERVLQGNIEVSPSITKVS
jgi:hypothetical protein